MKNLKALFCTLLVIMSLVFASCSSDEPGGSNSNVVGNWVGLDYDTFYHNVFITFNSDGTGTAGLDHSGATYSSTRAYFTYKVKGNKVTTSGSFTTVNNDGDVYQDSFNCTFKVNGNVLTLESSESGWYSNNVKTFKKQ